MLVNGRSLVTDLISDVNYQQRCSGIIYYLREDGWKDCYGLLKANILFLFESKNNMDSCPYLIIIEDCIIDLLDDNQTGKQFSFSIKHKTTGREFILAADTLCNLQRWVSDLTVCPLDYINTIKQSFDEQYLQRESSKGKIDEEK
uniref:PH domain-containing protein n=1 Tax=Strongyloides papillosus TaxID=174720 RepID=A0A0N5C1X1_STREA